MQDNLSERAMIVRPRFVEESFFASGSSEKHLFPIISAFLNLRLWGLSFQFALFDARLIIAESKHIVDVDYT